MAGGNAFIDGNVGIGVSSTAQKLHIDGNIRLSQEGYFDDNTREIEWFANNSGAVCGYIKMNHSDLEIKSTGGTTKTLLYSDGGTQVLNKLEILDNFSYTDLLFSVGKDDDNTIVEKGNLLIKNGGLRSGTGSFSDGKNLEVFGETKLSGELHVAGDSGSAFIDGNVGIGVSSTAQKLHVSGNIRAEGYLEMELTGGGGYLESTAQTIYENTILKATANSFFYEQKIIQQASTHNVSYHRAALIMVYGGSTQGIVNLSRYGYSGGYNESTSYHGSWTSAGYTTLTPYGGISDPGDETHYNNALMNFTGQHRCVTNNMDIDNIENYTGLIVCASGKYNTYNTNLMKQTTGKFAITICDALPIINFTTKKKQKNVFGILAYKEESERRFCAGNFHTPYPNDNDDKRVYVNSVGEGGIIIVNTNGNLENGDYIQSSDVFGYGEKQDDDILHNYTVAKITCDCDFILNSEDYECIEFVDSTSGNTYRKAFVGCTYHCG